MESNEPFTARELWWKDCNFLFLSLRICYIYKNNNQYGTNLYRCAYDENWRIESDSIRETHYYVIVL